MLLFIECTRFVCSGQCTMVLSRVPHGIKDANQRLGGIRDVIQGLYPQTLPECHILDPFHVSLCWRSDETEMILFDLKRSLAGEVRLSKIPHSGLSPCVL